ncbi:MULTISPECIES: VOC family protein [unclassified Sphingomonas]|uniref:VOC family protein n=1 Tax=unclassified Sphingomonas TaxID=196159 RepID=UPI000BC717CF|nr:MAG: glyoxalase [Sphingomonas sp. 28-62-11]
MTSAIIEHININVSNPERAAATAATLFGWAERWRGIGMDGRLTIHVGSAAHYIAYHQRRDTGPAGRFEKGVPFNHVGVQVDDLDAVEAGVVALGLTPFSQDDYEPGRRFYFFDDDGIEYEIVSYAPQRQRRSA